MAKPVVVVVMLYASILVSWAAAAPPATAVPAETKAARDARMAWFREAKFGLFIHWGLYSVPAGE